MITLGNGLEYHVDKVAHTEWAVQMLLPKQFERFGSPSVDDITVFLWCVSRHSNMLWSSTSSGWWFQPLWKILVSWGYYSQYMENKKCSKPPTSIYRLYNVIPIGCIYPIKIHQIAPLIVKKHHGCQLTSLSITKRLIYNQKNSCYPPISLMFKRPCFHICHFIYIYMYIIILYIYI